MSDGAGSGWGTRTEGQISRWSARHLRYNKDSARNRARETKKIVRHTLRRREEDASKLLQQRGGGKLGENKCPRCITGDLTLFYDEYKCAQCSHEPTIQTTFRGAIIMR